MGRRKIFVSAVSKELGSCRIAVEQFLRKLGYDTVHQDTWRQTSSSIVAKIRSKLEESDAVVCLIGERYGEEPSTPLDGYDRQSFTQFEHTYARELGLPIFLFLTDPESPPERQGPDPLERSVTELAPEPEELQELQRRFRDRVIRDRDWAGFQDKHQLLYELATLEYHWKARDGVDPEAAEREADPERGDLLADVFELDRNQLPDGLPDYAKAYLYGDFLEAERLAFENIARICPDDGKASDEKALAYWLAGLSAQQSKSQRSQEALESLEHALALTDDNASPRMRVQVQSSLGYVKLCMGDERGARDLLESCLEPARNLCGSEHNTTLVIEANLAMVLTQLGMPVMAEPLIRHVLEVRRRTQGPEHPRTLSARNKLANCLDQQGKLEEGYKQHFELRRVYSRIYGPEAPDTLRQHFNLAHNLGDQGELEEAAEEYVDLIQIYERMGGEARPEHGAALNDLAWTLYEMRDFEQSFPHARRAVKILNSSRGRQHRDTFEARHTFTLVQAALGEWKRAERDLRKLIDDQTRILGDEHASTLTSRYDLADLLSRHGAIDGTVLSELPDLQDRIEGSLGATHPLAAKCRALVERHRLPVKKT